MGEHRCSVEGSHVGHSLGHLYTLVTSGHLSRTGLTSCLASNLQILVEIELQLGLADPSSWTL